jgi:hypothetical protein
MLPLREHDQKHRSGHWLCQELSSKAPRRLHSMNDFTLFTPTYFTASRRRCFVPSVYTRHALPDGSQDHPYFKIHPSLNPSIGPAVPDSVSASRSAVVILDPIAALFCRPERNQTLCATNTNFLGSRISDGSCQQLNICTFQPRLARPRSGYYPHGICNINVLGCVFCMSHTRLWNLEAVHGTAELSARRSSPATRKSGNGKRHGRACLILRLAASMLKHYLVTPLGDAEYALAQS